MMLRIFTNTSLLVCNAHTLADCVCESFLQEFFFFTVELARPPVLLEGGYTQWYLHYSPLCVGPWKWEKGGRGGEGEGGEGGTEGDLGASGSSLDYPSFPDIL